MPKEDVQELISVLVVEDDEMFMNIATGMLSEYITYKAKTVKEALRSLKLYNPNIIFLDINLPDGTGYDFLDAIDTSENFVIMLTKSNITADVQKAVSKGANGYIVKPFSRKQIKDSVEKYLKHNKK
ncbi:response regulator [Rickettsiales bacterium]|nr:response regulator [Rickettsiales bacterium]